MNALASRPAPVIASIGAPPDLHAERIVREMLQWLHDERERLLPLTDGLIGPRQMGTPKGQMRVTKRLCEAFGPLALNVSLAPAKRGKFTLGVTEWRLWDPAVEDGVVAAGAAVSAGAGLGAVLNVFTSVHRRPEVETMAPLRVSRHACVRLAQRANVRTVGDMIVAMRGLWAGAWAIVGEHKNNWLAPPGGAWLVPLHKIEASPVVVLEPCKSGAKRLVAVTVLDACMVDGASAGRSWNSTGN